LVLARVLALVVTLVLALLLSLLRALVLTLDLALVLALVLALLLSGWFADIAASTLLRCHPRGKLVSERGEGVALARPRLWLRTAGEFVRIRPCPGPRSAISLGL
jgi:hypothetical protein